MKSVWVKFFFLTGIVATMVLYPFQSKAQLLDSPVLQCVSTNESTGDVTISWSLPTLNACGPFVSYTLFGATNVNGPYNVVATITNPTQTTFLHAGANATILNWHYFMTTQQNCPGAISLSSDTIEERLIITPQMDVVSVQNGGIEITWFPSPSPQTAGYYIYKCVGGLLTVLHDSVQGINNTFYLDLRSDPDTGSVCYAIAAFDACGTQSLNNVFFGTAHQSIFVRGNIVPCDRNLELTFTPYKNWPDSLIQYEIQVNLDGGAFVPVSTTGLLNSNLNSIIENLDLSTLDGEELCVRLRALHPTLSSKTAFSNDVCFPFNQIRSTAFNHIRLATFDTVNGQFLVDFFIDTTANIQSLNLKANLGSQADSLISSLTAPNPIPFQNQLIGALNPSVGPYQWTVESLDDCNFSLPSAPAQTIFLRGNTDQAASNTLQWSAYQLANATLFNYRIFRNVGGSWINIATVLPDQLSYVHEILNETSDDGLFCYVVQSRYRLIIPEIGINEDLTTTSNILCLQQCPVVYIPNAFVPGGVNARFRPVFLYENLSSYLLQIFDRWGKLVFESRDLTQGWDGTFRGELLPLGGYTYQLKAEIPSSVCSKVEKTGIVLLVR